MLTKKELRRARKLYANNPGDGTTWAYAYHDTSNNTLELCAAGAGMAAHLGYRNRDRNTVAGRDVICTRVFRAIDSVNMARIRNQLAGALPVSGGYSIDVLAGERHNLTLAMFDRAIEAAPR